MDNRLPAELTIVTSIARAIKLHPFTCWSSDQQNDNDFLKRFKVDFQKPTFYLATLSRSAYAPHEDWLYFFDEAEKEVIEDEYSFYGVRYQTSVKLAKRRVAGLLKKIEDSIGEQRMSNASEKDRVKFGRMFYNRDGFKDAKEGLKLFDDNDEIAVNFMFADWPNVEDAKRKEYIKEFEDKLLGKRTEPDDIPF